MPNCTAISNTQTVDLTAGTLTSGFCHETLQLTFNEFVAKTTGQLAGNMAAFTAGDDTPSGDDQDKLWFKQDGTPGNDCVPVDGGWHWYNANAAPAAWESVHTHTGTHSPVGVITMWAGNNLVTPPTGWNFCHGATLSRTTYSALFAVIGTTYGIGDGSTTFTLPNLKSRVPMGWDDGDTDYEDLNNTGGEKETTLTEAQMPSHSHDVLTGPAAGVTGSQPYYGGNFQGTTSTEGGDEAHENRPPYIVLNFIIKIVA